jgi:hypothetical protein
MDSRQASQPGSGGVCISDGLDGSTCVSDGLDGSICVSDGLDCSFGLYCPDGSGNSGDSDSSVGSGFHIVYE